MGVFAAADTSIGLYDKQKRHGQSAPWRRIGSENYRATSGALSERRAVDTITSCADISAPPVEFVIAGGSVPRPTRAVKTNTPPT